MAAGVFGAMRRRDEVARPDRRPRSPAETFGSLFERVALAAIHDDGKNWADPQPLRAAGSDHAQPSWRRRRRRTRTCATSWKSISSTDPWRPALTPVAGLDVHDSHRRALAGADPHLAGRPPVFFDAVPAVPLSRAWRAIYRDLLLGLLFRPARRERPLCGRAKPPTTSAHLIRAHGHVPNGNRTYYPSRSQPPFFFMVAGLTEPQDPVAAYAALPGPELIAEHRFWMRGPCQAAAGSPVWRVVPTPDGSAQPLLGRQGHAARRVLPETTSCSPADRRSPNANSGETSEPGRRAAGTSPPAGWPIATAST